MILIILIAAVILFSLTPRETQAAVNIVCTSGNQYYVDASVNLTGRYVSYQITNTGPAIYDNIWVQIGGFTGGVVSLAPNSSDLYHLDSLNAGQTKTAFFYIQASNTTSIPQSHTISVYNGEPPSGALLASATFSFSSIGSSISAASNKITTIVSGPTPPTLGGILTVTVDGDAGIIGRNGVMIFSPAGFPDWFADSYELLSTEITLSGGINVNLHDRLFYSANGLRDISYHAVYTFKVVDIAPGPTVASPVATITSGTRMKHDNINSYYIVNPIQPAINSVMLRKTVMPQNIVGGDTAIYAITIFNSGMITVRVDSITDLLPSSPALPVYLSGSSLFNAIHCADPQLSGSRLKWIGPFSIDSGMTATLAFSITFPTIEGAYTNLALGAVGNALIDSTLDPADYAPASVTIIVGMPDIIMLKSAQVISDPVNGSNNPKAIPGAEILYTITVANHGVGMADNHSVITGDRLPPGMSLFVGDIGNIGSGPILFLDGTPPSGMTYSFGGLGNVMDNLAFSSDSGATYTYAPIPDSSGFDPHVTNISINPSGSFQGAAGGSYPNFTIRFMALIR